MELEKLGWSGFFASQKYAGVPGRVASAIRERFQVWTEHGEISASAGGQLRYAGAAWPAVGDWVMLGRGEPVIQGVFQRKSVLSRKEAGRVTAEQVLAANIDVLFVVCGLDHDFNERRIERYLVVAQQSGARPVILLNKGDLAARYGHDLDGIVERIEHSSNGVRVLGLSALTGEGLDVIGALLRPGETAALIGSSGAGKSTIVNALLGERRQAVSEVREGDDRGRHTTTTRSLFQMPGGWLLIDMPGLREVQLWASPESLEASFDDILEVARGCRFRDCTHSCEPGCAVAEARFEAGRLENYHKMQRELDYLDRKADKRAMSEMRARWKVIHKAMREGPKRGW